ncbi:hypothetical protein, partial [Terracidiphilus sp.]|uniref:hypothetical protein n=1 Tax=Terracidiphilus sp. TaxID=1964191 RepID=UPI003C18A362
AVTPRSFVLVIRLFCDASITGPQRRGTGGTLILVRDRGHPPLMLSDGEAGAIGERRECSEVSRGNQVSEQRKHSVKDQTIQGEVKEI